jgi:opacity protein-like surface antigen
MILTLSFLIAAVPGLALAQDDAGSGGELGFRGWGPRVGLTMDPDQVHVGMHMDYGVFGPRVRFQPNVEAGFGDNLTLIAFNFEAAYRFRDRWDAWTPYLGGGLGLNWVNWDSGYGNGDSDTDIGASLLGGIERGLKNGNRFFLEAKLGLADSPDAKFTAGWTFYH